MDSQRLLDKEEKVVNMDMTESNAQTTANEHSCIVTHHHELLSPDQSEESISELSDKVSSLSYSSVG